MMREYAETGQAGSVTPPRPTKPGADSRTFAPPSSGTASPCVTSHLPSPPREQPERQCHWQTLFSYNSATAVAVLADKIATKLFAAATETLPLQIQTRSTPCNTLMPNRTPLRPYATPRNPSPSPLSPTPRHPAPIRHMCQLRPSYDHSTNSTPPRYKSRFFSYESVESPYLRVDTNPPNIPSPNHDEIRRLRPAPQTPPMRLIRQLRPSYDHATNATPLRYKSLFSRYERSLTPYLAPICDGTVPHPKSRPIRPNYHYETRPHTSEYSCLLSISQNSRPPHQHPRPPRRSAIQ